MNTAKEYSRILSTLSLFAQTDQEVLTSWLSEHAGTPVEIKQGERADTADVHCLGILLQGRLEIQSADNEKTIILRTLHAPDIFGVASLFMEGDLPLSKIKAKSCCKLLYISLEAVRILLARDQGFRDAYLSFLAGRVRFLNRKIQCFTAGSAERKLALWLISEDQKNIVLPSSVSSLADMLDLGRASLYRALDKLESDGLISRDGRKITLLSQEKLLQKYQ